MLRALFAAAALVSLAADAAVPAALSKEKRCVTMSRLKSAQPGAGKELGRLRTRRSPEIGESPFFWWSVGCECMDRDYADWNAYKELLPMLGVKHGRLISGWAKTEREKGKYDFSWLDPHVREMSEMGVKPWITLAYGNPVWGCEKTLGSPVRQITENEEAIAAWLRYVAAVVERYGDAVDEWEIWNEPFRQAEYPEFFLQTARTIRTKQAGAKIFAACINDVSATERLLERLKSENALSLCSRLVYHPYNPDPDAAYASLAMPLRELAKKYSPSIDILQGESGCPAQLEFDHALNGFEWSEYAQAKWDLRRAIGDAAHGIPSSCFAIIDFQYTWMLQSFGLVRSNARREVVYRRPAFFAMRNVYSLFDAGMSPAWWKIVERGGFNIALAEFERDARKLRFFWKTGNIPSNDIAFDKIDLSCDFPEPRDLVWVDMITGRVFALGSASAVPVWDAPALVCEREAIDFESSCDLPFTVDGMRYSAIPGEKQEINLQWVYPDDFTGDNGTKKAEIRFSADAPEKGDYDFPFLNDFFGELYVNGRFVRNTEGPAKWGVLSIPLDKGRNDILFLSRSGSLGWRVGFEIPEQLKCKDDVVIATERFQRMIEHCHEAGGGRVVVPPGRHLVGQLDLRSNVELHLEKGAVLEGLVGLEHYRVTELPWSEGTWSAVVSGIGVTNVAVTGEGEIFGNGSAWPQPPFGECSAGREGLRPRGVFFADTKNIRLEDFTLRDSACWGVVFKCCDGVSVRRVKIDSHCNENNDGFDIEARNVLVENCEVDVGDDAFCIKSNDPGFIVENVVIRDSTARTHCNACKIGTATRGVVRNVRFERISCSTPRRDFIDRRKGSPSFGRPYFSRRAFLGYAFGNGLSALAIENVDGGCVEKIVGDGISAEGYAVPLFIRGGKRKSLNGLPSSGLFVFSNVTVSNFKAKGLSPVASSITGVEGLPIRNVTLHEVDIVSSGADEEVSAKALSEAVPDVPAKYPECFMFNPCILPAYGLYADRVNGLTLDGVRLSLVSGSRDVRPPFKATDRVSDLKEVQ